MRKNIKRMIAANQEVVDPTGLLHRIFTQWCSTTDGRKTAELEEAFNQRLRQLCDRSED